MAELYWITRLDYIQGCLLILLIIIAVILIGAVIAWSMDDTSEYPSQSLIKLSKITIPSFVITLLVFCFVPSTKEAMMIYGVGGTIDYIKSNDKAKELPDKCIDALTRYVDSIEPEKTNKQ